jgi:tetratricopeptide (TPR) repeat protein
LYPSLRTARTEIWTVKPKKTDAQISLLAGQISTGKVSMDTLTAEELSYAGTLTPILSEKVAIYEALVKKTDNWAAYNNLGAVYLEQAKVEVDQNKKKELINKAINTLEMSIKKQDSGESHVNLASAYMLSGVRASSRDEANKAVASNTSDAVKKGANGILGTLDVKDGKYDIALQDLSKSNDSLQVKFNSALASLLKKDFNTAKAGFANYTAAAPNDAAGYYLAAVTAARQKDEATLTTNLKKAKALSAKFGERAVSDMEFYDYWNSENFKNALK